MGGDAGVAIEVGDCGEAGVLTEITPDLQLV